MQLLNSLYILNLNIWKIVSVIDSSCQGCMLCFADEFKVQMNLLQGWQNEENH